MTHFMLVCRNYGAIKLIVPLIVTYFVAIQTGRVISKVVGKLTHLYTVTFNLLSPLQRVHAYRTTPNVRFFCDFLLIG